MAINQGLPELNFTSQFCFLQQNYPVGFFVSLGSAKSVLQLKTIFSELAKSHFLLSFCFILQDEEQQEMVNSAAFIEEQYGHLIDTVLVKEDLQSACSQLKTILEKLNTDCFWVPVSWVKL